MKASLTGALVSHPEHAGLLDNLGYSMVEDFRGRWESRVEMVDYSIREFWPKMRQTLLVNEDYQSGLSCLDYLIASRGFVFTLNPAVQDEREMASRVYRMAPQHSILFGWPADEEVRTVSAASEHNLLVLCDGGAANLSVHAGVPALLFGCIKRVEKVSRKRVIAIMATCFAIIVAITVPVLYYVPEALSKTEFHRLVWLAKSALGRLG